MSLINYFCKSDLFLVVMWSQNVDVARWVRPAIEHAQDVLYGGLGHEGENDFVLVFKGPCLVFTFVLYYCLFSFCFFGCVLFSKNKLFVVWVCPAFFWCLIVSF